MSGTREAVETMRKYLPSRALSLPDNPHRTLDSLAADLDLLDEARGIMEALDEIELRSFAPWQEVEKRIQEDVRPLLARLACAKEQRT